MTDDKLGIVLVSRSRENVTRALRAFHALEGAGLVVHEHWSARSLEAPEMRVEVDPQTPDGDLVGQDVLRTTRLKARAFLNGVGAPIHLSIVIAGSFEDAVLTTEALREPIAIGFTLIDRDAVLVDPHQPDDLATRLTLWYEALAKAGIATLRSPYSDVVWVPASDFEAVPYQNTLDYRLRVLADEAWVTEAEITALFTTYLQNTFTNRMARKRLKGSDAQITLGVELAACMQARFGQDWILSYYTGSIVSSLINTLDKAASGAGARIALGPNEHSLACGAFIHARLYGRGYLMVLTSSMIDELKGTLANLQQLGARGLIVCADAVESKWFGFQATVNSDADIRRVLEARRIPFVYLQHPEELRSALARVAELLDSHDGPVALIATQAPLEYRTPLDPRPDLTPARAPVASVEVAGHPGIAEAIRIVNQEPVRLLWQCGALDGSERDLALDIAARAGIALSDALSAPGFLPAYVDGRRIPNYLGPLGQYGTSQEVFEYLTTEGKLRPREAQWLFVLKGKLGQIDSPFSDADHARRLRIAQVNKTPAHLAPFAALAIGMPVLDFLRAVREGLAVEPDVLAHREHALAEVRKITDPLSEIPALPMNPTYFFARLRRAVETLIVERGYRYAGMFDVGHNGTLAVRCLPRTGPSYSGWYGRGLMGDALQATGILATTGDDNVLAVIGDGARHITADILPNIIESLNTKKAPIGKNVSVFYLVNNAFSVINSYQQRMMSKPGGRQMLVSNHEAFAEPDASVDVYGTRIVRRRILHANEAALADDLGAPNRINLFSVPVLNTDDGISIIDIESWQYLRV